MEESSFTSREWPALSRGCVRVRDYDGLRGAQVGIGLPNGGLKVVVRIVVGDCKCTMMIWVWCDKQERIIASGTLVTLSDLIDPAAIQLHLKSGTDPLPACIQQLEELVSRVFLNEPNWVNLFRNLRVSKSERVYRTRRALARSI